jgi:glutathione peroxidase-family protein
MRLDAPIRRLQQLYSEYKDRHFKVLGFPANNFMGQEPGTEQEIKDFCDSNYSVEFPLFSKISVKGDDQHELYKYLTEANRKPMLMTAVLKKNSPATAHGDRRQAKFYGISRNF